ncbi:MAG: aminotransferase class I/II-fold pyridoxal phosphate-dependent enzyme [Rhodobacterales bacterium]|nr:aminotransferase class I/II-fold pyridoxal phosphate-dependent enzyme [Rhodobacterales bacterium]
MSDASAINRVIAAEIPALSRCLSELGKSLVFPEGIPFQAAQAKRVSINATIGQLTDGRGGALPLEPLRKRLQTEPKRTWLYAPVAGPESLRNAWRDHQRKLAGQPDAACSLPFTTHGLTHAIDLIAGLVADDELDILLATPAWENYGLVFRLRGGGRMVRYNFFDDTGTRFNIDGLAQALRGVRKKAVVVLNFPNNPTGYVPTVEERAAIVTLLNEQQKPAIVLCDDAYQGWVYADRPKTSLFWDFLANHNAEHLFPVKVDGATKEMVFFSSRVGFVTHTATGAGEAALLSKLKCQTRGSVGCPPGPSMALMEAGLADPGLKPAFEERLGQMARRQKLLYDCLQAEAGPALVPFPFHGAFFALVKVVDAEAVRQRLLEHYDTGVIAFQSASAVRVAFCSLNEETIPEVAKRLGAAAREVAALQ